MQSARRRSARPGAARRAAACLLGALAGAWGAGAHAAEPARLWPLLERTCVTGTFGEYRTGHYHAGIDISTRGGTGLPVRAVADGRVVRLRASPYGYGRTIYYDTEDGHQVVCAHLSDFAPRWRALVEAEQERLGKFTVDFAVPDSPRVAAGEILAFTGASGAGPPHLHFEVRRGDAEPVNPLTNGWEAPDAAPPLIRALRLVPLGLDGRVDGGLDPVVVAVAPEGVGAAEAPEGARTARYRAARAIAIDGPVGVEVLAADGGTGCEPTRAPHGLSLAFDGEERFRVAFERVSYFGDWAQVDVRYDYGAIAAGDGEYLRAYDPIRGEGAVPGDRAGEHVVEVTVRDEAGNAAACALRVEGGRAENPWWEEHERSRATKPSPDPDSVSRRPTPEPRGGRTPSEVGPPTWRLVPEGLIVRVDRAVMESGAEVGFFMEVPGGGVWAFGPLPGPDRVASDSDAIWFTAPDLGPPEGGTWPITDSFGGGIRVRLARYAGKGETGGLLETLLLLGPFARGLPDKELSFQAPSGRGRLVIPRDGLFAPALFTAIGEPHAPAVPAGLSLVEGPVRYAPDDALLAAPAEVRFALPATDGAAGVERLAVYSVSRRGGLRSLGGSIDPATGEIVATTRHLGTFALVEDLSPPRLSGLRPASGSVTSRARPRILVRVTEVGEGLDDEGVRVTIDGARLIPEYDPDAETIVARPKTPLAPGRHTLEIRLSDKAGNAASGTSRFTVAAPEGGTTKGTKGKKCGRSPR